MADVVWLAGPYLSILVICRSPEVARRVAGHTGVTLVVGWAALLALFGAVTHLWEPPVPVVAAFAALSGLAMITTGRRRGDDGPEPEDDEPPPLVDWDAFDAARRRWAEDRVGHPRRG